MQHYETSRAMRPNCQILLGCAFITLFYIKLRCLFGRLLSKLFGHWFHIWAFQCLSGFCFWRSGVFRIQLRSAHL